MPITADDRIVIRRAFERAKTQGKGTEPIRTSALIDLGIALSTQDQDRFDRLSESDKDSMTSVVTIQSVLDALDETE